MKTSIGVVLYFFGLSLYNVASTRDKRMSWIPKSWLKDNTGATAAEKFLLKGSHLLLKLPHAVVYEKAGRQNTAIEDFYALRPINVKHLNKETQMEIHGQVGKQLVTLSTGKRVSNKEDTFPQITIASFEPGKDSKYNIKMKVFWYLGGYSDNQIVEI